MIVASPACNIKQPDSGCFFISKIFKNMLDNLCITVYTVHIETKRGGGHGIV